MSVTRGAVSVYNGKCPMDAGLRAAVLMKTASMGEFRGGNKEGALCFPLLGRRSRECISQCWGGESPSPSRGVRGVMGTQAPLWQCKLL